MIDRRTFLAVGAVGAVSGAGVLAGCAGGTSSGSASPTPSPGSPLVALADVPVGGAVAARTASGADVVVAQPTAGEVVAFSAVCTHAGCVVEVAATALACPCHGSAFDPLTGEVQVGPATRALPPFAVAVDGDQVVEA